MGGGGLECDKRRGQQCFASFPASPNLTWRDVQHIIVLTSRKDHLKSPSWTTNGAGLQFSHRFGFGMLNAAAIVNRALHWVTVPERLNCSVRATGLPK